METVRFVDDEVRLGTRKKRRNLEIEEYNFAEDPDISRFCFHETACFAADRQVPVEEPVREMDPRCSKTPHDS